MPLPRTLRYLQPGWWALHLLAIPALFGGGIALGIFHAGGHGGADGGHGGAHEEVALPAPSAGGPIRDEMLDLQVAYDAMNRAVILGDTTGVVDAFHRVHARKEVTSAAIAAGTAKPPRNGDQVDLFVAKDEAFHAVIGAAVQAAAENDLPALQAASAQMTAGCVDCHQHFR